MTKLSGRPRDVAEACRGRRHSEEDFIRTTVGFHSRFGLDRTAQTERLVRAMDNHYFTILGHATGRLLLKRRGYEIDAERVIEHAVQAGSICRLAARLAGFAGVRIAVDTDADSTREFGLVRYGIEARKAGLAKLPS